jgi:uncharacterized RDD family membrane protein YckC
MRFRFLVRTPENVVFEHELASIPARALAWAADVLVMAALVLGSLRLVEMLGGSTGFATAIGFVAVFLVQWWYGALLEWWLGGQTVGKRWVGLRVLDTRGLRIGFVAAVVRNLLRIVDLLPGLYLVGGVSAWIDPWGRRLGDLGAGTVVVRERRLPPPTAMVAVSERHNSFALDPLVRLAVRRVTAPERDAMVALGLRREWLPPSVRHALFARLASHLEARLGVPRPPHFSPEKYVLHLTSVVLA